MSALDKLTPGGFTPASVIEELRAELGQLNALAMAINAAWLKLYQGGAVTEQSKLLHRIQAMAEDCQCHMANSSEANKAYVKMDNRLRAEIIKQDALHQALADVWAIARHHVTHHTLGGEVLAQRVEALLPDYAKRVVEVIP